MFKKATAACKLAGIHEPASVIAGTNATGTTHPKFQDDASKAAPRKLPHLPSYNTLKSTARQLGNLGQNESSDGPLSDGTFNPLTPSCRRDVAKASLAANQATNSPSTKGLVTKDLKHRRSFHSVIAAAKLKLSPRVASDDSDVASVSVGRGPFAQTLFGPEKKRGQELLKSPTKATLLRHRLSAGELVTRFGFKKKTLASNSPQGVSVDTGATEIQNLRGNYGNPDVKVQSVIDNTSASDSVNLSSTKHGSDGELSSSTQYSRATITVDRAMPSEYWTGRFQSTYDRLRENADKGHGHSLEHGQTGSMKVEFRNGLVSKFVEGTDSANHVPKPGKRLLVKGLSTKSMPLLYHIKDLESELSDFSVLTSWDEAGLLKETYNRLQSSCGNSRATRSLIAWQIRHARAKRDDQFLPPGFAWAQAEHWDWTHRHDVNLMEAEYTYNRTEWEVLRLALTLPKFPIRLEP